MHGLATVRGRGRRAPRRCTARRRRRRCTRSCRGGRPGSVSPPACAVRAHLRRLRDAAAHRRPPAVELRRRAGPRARGCGRGAHAHGETGGPAADLRVELVEDIIWLKVCGRRRLRSVGRVVRRHGAFVVKMVDANARRLGLLGVLRLNAADDCVARLLGPPQAGAALVSVSLNEDRPLPSLRLRRAASRTVGAVRRRRRARPA